jgi:hypothetical protein
VTYPLWKYFPSNATPPDWALAMAALVARHAGAISTANVHTGLKSDEVLAELRDDLELLGFVVEAGKTKMDKVARAVLYGEGGVPEVNYEIDGFHDDFGIALEVEAGRGAANNADYRDIVRTSLILDAQYLVLMQAIAYRSNPGAGAIHAYANTRSQIEAIYASQRLRLPFKGLLLIGY